MELFLLGIAVGMLIGLLAGLSGRLWRLWRKQKPAIIIDVDNHVITVDKLPSLQEGDYLVVKGKE